MGAGTKVDGPFLGFSKENRRIYEADIMECKWNPCLRTERVSGILSGSRCRYFSGDHYETRIYKAEEYIAVASADHTFENSVHSLKDLTSERLLIREHGSGTRAILTKTLALKNMSVKDFRHLVEIENIHTIVTLLKEDCGISFLYKAAVEQELKKGTLVQIPLSDFMVMHDFTFLWNKDSVFSQEYESIFHDLCEN